MSYSHYNVTNISPVIFFCTGAPVVWWNPQIPNPNYSNVNVLPEGETFMDNCQYWNPMHCPRGFNITPWSAENVMSYLVLNIVITPLASGLINAACWPQQCCPWSWSFTLRASGSIQQPSGNIFSPVHLSGVWYCYNFNSTPWTSGVSVAIISGMS